MSFQWVDIRDGKQLPMACDMAQLADGESEDPAPAAPARRPLAFWAWLAMRRRDPSRRTH